MIELKDFKERSSKGGEFPAITVYNLVKYIEHLQSEIDALMLEYCPEQMTPEQFENWAKHQVKSEVDEF